jgi:hypothetical protein
LLYLYFFQFLNMDEYYFFYKNKSVFQIWKVLELLR